MGIESNPYYRPGSWVPHCSVAQNLARDRLPEAVRICSASAAFGPLRLESVGLVEYRPVVDLYEFPLGS